MSTLRIVNGDRVWRNEAGELHRLDGPAKMMINGTKEWWVHGQIHREGGPGNLGQIHPAIEYANGCKEWWSHDQRHREDSPAIEWVDGDLKEWWIHGKRHREDGPAIEWGNGMKEWWIHGKPHRADGPAVEVDDHEYKYNKWCFRGSDYDFYEFTNLLVQHHLKLHLLTEVVSLGSENLVDKYSL
jgi:hypothetical protein